MATLEELLEKIRDALLAFYKEDLFSAVIFGSAARGDFHKESDLDLLIVLRESKASMGKRIDDFMKVEWEIRKSPEYATAKAHGVPHRIEPAILGLEELRRHPPLLLDLTTDVRILIDRRKVFSREMDKLRKRLQSDVLTNTEWRRIGFPDWFLGRTEAMARIMREITPKRGLAMYGFEAEMKPANAIFSRDDGVKATTDGRFVFETCKRFLKEWRRSASATLGCIRVREANG